MPVGKPTPQTIATKKYEKKAGWMSKSYKLKREVVEEFAPGKPVNKDDERVC